MSFASFPKTKGVRNESYRRYVASLPCIACGISGISQAAHPNSGRGLGQKASDLDVFPLCCTRYRVIGCHVRFDQLIGITRDERRELEKRYIARTQKQAVKDGRGEFNEASISVDERAIETDGDRLHQVDSGWFQRNDSRTDQVF